MCQTGPKVLFLQVLVPLPSFSLHSLLMKSGTTEAPLGSKIAGCQRLALLVAPPVMFMVKSQGPMTYGDGNSQRSWGWYIYIYYIYIHTQYVRDDIQATSRWFERFTTCHQPSVCQLLFGGVKPAVKKNLDSALHAAMERASEQTACLAWNVCLRWKEVIHLTPFQFSSLQLYIAKASPRNMWPPRQAFLRMAKDASHHVGFGLLGSLGLVGRDCWRLRCWAV